MNSSTVSAGNPGLASEYNNLRKDLIVQAGQYAVSTGSANAYLLSIDAQFVAYTAGDNFEFQANFANTGSATLNVNSVGAKTLKDPQGNTLGANAIPSGAVVRCVYNGTDLICYGGIVATTSNVGFAEMATDAEVVTGTDETRYVNPKQVYQDYPLAATSSSTGGTNGTFVSTGVLMAKGGFASLSGYVYNGSGSARTCQLKIQYSADNSAWSDGVVVYNGDPNSIETFYSGMYYVRTGYYVRGLASGSGTSATATFSIHTQART